jgi:hypothetical protein
MFMEFQMRSCLTPLNFLACILLCGATNAHATDLPISYALTGPQAADFQITDSDWRTFSAVDRQNNLFELQTDVTRDAGNYVDGTGAVHHVVYTGNVEVYADYYTPYVETSRSLSLSALPTHAGPFDVQLTLDTPDGVAITWSAAGSLQPFDPFAPPHFPNPAAPDSKTWDAALQGPYDSSPSSVVDPFENMFMEMTGRWQVQGVSFKPGHSVLTLSLPATGSIESFSLYLLAERTYSNGYWGTERSANFFAMGVSDTIIQAAPVPEPEAWALSLAGLMVAGAGMLRRKS